MAETWLRPIEIDSPTSGADTGVVMAGLGQRTWTRAATLVVAATASLIVAPSHAVASSNYRITGVDSGLEAVAKAQATLITSHLGITLHKKLAVGYAFFKHDIENASTVMVDSVNGSADRSGPVCQIVVNQTWLAKQAQATAKQEVLAHEVFHCFEHQIAPDIVTKDGEKNASPWVIEGLARWVDLDLYPSDPDTELYGAIPYYVDHSGRGLFERTYDAAGFWGHVEDVTHDLWKRIPKIIEQNVGLRDGAAFNAAVGSERTAVLDSWGSSVFGLGPPPWTTFSPLTGSPGYPAAIPTTIDRTGGVVLKPYTTAQLKLEPPTSQPLVAIHLSAGVYGRFGVSENYTDNAVTDKVYCAGSSCSGVPVGCSGGGSSTLPPLTPLPSEPMLGVASTGAGGSADVTYFNSAQSGGFCPHPGPGPGGGGGGGGGSGGGGSLQCYVDCGSSEGDPHVTTFSGVDYDFQAAGEFTLVKSPSRDMDVQVRQQPYPGSRDVSISTAVAMRVGRATVEVDAINGSSNGILLVNRRRVRSASRITRELGGGASLVKRGGVVTVTWSDRSKVQVTLGPAFGCRHGLMVAVKVARRRFKHVSGLLGDAGVAPGSELVGGNGHRYGLTSIESPYTAHAFDVLYHQFGRSWQVNPRDSLFVYPSGKSSRSYDDSSFPSKAATLGMLGPRQFAAAQRECQVKRVTNSALLANCIFDVSLTSDPCFGFAARQLQVSIGGPPPGTGGVSPIGWTQLSAHSDGDPLFTPSLAAAGSRLLASYPASGDSAIETATFAASSTGVSAVSQSDPFTGWRDIGGGPRLFSAPGGVLQMIFSGDHTAAAKDPLNGTEIVPIGPNGAAGEPVNAGVSPYPLTGVRPNVDFGAVLAADGQTPEWTATSGFSLQLERGAQSAASSDLSGLVSGQVPHGATLAHDTSGRLWLAWYAQTHDPSTNGQYLLQLDPTGAGPAPGATPQHAPNSGISFGTIDNPALVCTQLCRLVYEDSSGDRIDQWAPGQRSPTTLATDPGQVSEPTAAHTASGRLWVTWVEVSTGRVLAQLTGGQPIILQKPNEYGTPLYSTSLTYGNLLVLVTNWENGFAGTGTGQTAVWATVVAGGS